MMNKIIIGSANFDQKYGIKKNFIGKKEIKTLLNIASKNRINKIDTSPLYKKSEQIIGSLNKNRFKIISKVPPLPVNIKKKDVKAWLNENIVNSLKNLKIKNFECLLLHNSNILLGKKGNEIYKSIRSIKKQGLTRKIGLSIYDSGVLEKILKKFKFDLIQAPFSIFDRRMINEGWLKKLKRKKIKIHARSVFLQGTLLLKKSKLPNKLKKFDNEWTLWENWLRRNKLKPLEACISFVLNQSQLDGVVIGFDNRKQFNQILKLKKNKRDFYIENLRTNNKKLIDPRQWGN